MTAITITTLSNPVSIIHIPISLIEIYITKIYWTIDKSLEKSFEFFNLTCNQIEMAIFGSLDLINNEWSLISFKEEEKGEKIIISNNWRVFEISSGDQDEIGNFDSPHLRHVSAPLAKAGISILYQSSYFTDFLLVKESDFEKAHSIFANQGWQVDPCAAPSTRRRSLLSPLTPSHSSFSPLRPASTPTPEITVLSSPLACIGYSRSAENRFAEKVKKFLVWPERCCPSSKHTHHLMYDEDDGTESEISTSLYIEKPRSRPFISYTRNEDGSSLVTEVKALRIIFNDENDDEYSKASELIRFGGELFHENYQEGDENEGDYHSHSEGESIYSVSNNVKEFSGQLITPPPERNKLISRKEKLEDHNVQHVDYSLPPTPSDRHFDPFEEDTRSEYSVGEVPIKWSGKDVSGRSENDGSIGKKRCLQLDLRGFNDWNEDEGGAYHLDKSGLVTRFSDLLTSSSKPIRMLYSSTFHTANILVEARDVKKAKSLLERKRRSVEWN
ncbi:uncharacterized protein I206_105007 [Kwoniella pini CBS 10737]|uniref:CASTOR ACT domain-containing protein n=1 Tax=Kwoniella pini CBS 10737 TaxID=1296096 RepID=A0AAJ8L6F0_9TREE